MKDEADSLHSAFTASAYRTLMRHLIVVSHPAADSFTLAVTHTYAETLAQLGHLQETCDLYRMGFDPVLPASELAAAPSDAAVRQAQDRVRAADAIAFIYPLWWLSMPAMLKGYVDRVFSRGFAYEMVKGTVHGLLTRKKAVLITISGAPMSALVESGDWDAMRMLQDKHIFRAAGLELVEHLHLDEVVPHLSTFAVDEHLERVRACARNNFRWLPRTPETAPARPSSNLHGIGTGRS